MTRGVSSWKHHKKRPGEAPRTFLQRTAVSETAIYSGYLATTKDQVLSEIIGSPVAVRAP